MKFLKVIFIAFLICLISPEIILAQKKGHLSLNGGLSKPDSYYNGDGSEDYSFENAEIGYNFQLSLNYRIVGFFGLSAMYHWQSNGIEAEKYEKFSPIYGSSMEATTGNLKVQGLFLGPLFSFKIYKELRIEGRLMLSYAQYSSPEVTLIDRSNATPETYTRPVKKANAPTALLGLGLKYPIFKRFCVLLNIEYLRGKPDFSPIDFESPVYGPVGQPYIYYPSIITINYNIGFGVIF